MLFPLGKVVIVPLPTVFFTPWICSSMMTQLKIILNGEIFPVSSSGKVRFPALLIACSSLYGIYPVGAITQSLVYLNNMCLRLPDLRRQGMCQFLSTIVLQEV